MMYKPFCLCDVGGESRQSGRGCSLIVNLQLDPTCPASTISQTIPRWELLVRHSRNSDIFQVSRSAIARTIVILFELNGMSSLML